MKIFRLLVVCCLFFSSCQPENKLAIVNDPKVPGVVGAHYYLWYPDHFQGNLFLRARLNPVQAPTLGIYNSYDTKIIEQHISWASQYGIDFFTLDWWRNQPQRNKIIEESFLKASNINDIKFCVFYESIDLGLDKRYGTIHFDDKVKQKFLKDLDQISSNYFQHPQYLRIDGKPVLFLYVSRIFSGNYLDALDAARRLFKEKGTDIYLIGDEVFWHSFENRDKRPKNTISGPDPAKWERFDAITNYNLYHRRKPEHAGYAATSSLIADYSELLGTFQKHLGPKLKLIPSVIPRYNDRVVRETDLNYLVPGQFAKGEKEGTFFSRSLDKIGIPFIDEQLGMLLITSWNEWNEGTAIEPVSGGAATSRDTSESGKLYTDGFNYEAYGTKYLEVLRNKVVAVAGQVNAGVKGLKLTLSKSGKTFATTNTDSNGYFRFSRRVVIPGKYVLSAAGGFEKKVEVKPGVTAIVQGTSS